ncbi:E3 ubiquitin/ISG15 ligase TRIM25-like [Gastrophryne carolinensis]
MSSSVLPSPNPQAMLDVMEAEEEEQGPFPSGHGGEHVARREKLPLLIPSLFPAMASADLEVEMTCSICTEIYREPATLTCGHSFCRECITKTFDNQEHREYRCPECMKRFLRRPELKKNVRLTNIAECFQHPQLEEGKTSLSCSYCVHASVPAVKSCLLCEASLCDVHLRTHNKSPEHVITDPTASPGDRKCPIHKRILEYYCTVDDTCVCPQCLASDHNGHRVENMEVSYEQKRKALMEFLEKIETRTRSLQEQERGVKEKASDLTERVINTLRVTERQLEDLQRQVLGDISRHETDMLQPLATRIEQLQKIKSHIEERMRTTDLFSAFSSGFFSLANNEDIVAEEERGRTIPDQDERLIFESLHSGLAEIVANISDDLKHVSRSKMFVERPEALERFECDQVLSIGQVSSGRRVWELERLYNSYTARHDNNISVIQHKPSVRRIRMELDYEAGRLTFYELRNPITALHTFTAKFTEPLHLVVYIDGSSWVKVSQ